MRITASRAAGRLGAIPAGCGLPCPTRCPTERGEAERLDCVRWQRSLGGNCFGIKGLQVMIQPTRQGFAIEAHGPGNAVAGTGADPPATRRDQPSLHSPSPSRHAAWRCPEERGMSPYPQVPKRRGGRPRHAQTPPRLRTGSCAEPSARAATWRHRFPLGSAREAAHQDAFPSSWRPPPGPRQSGRPWKKGPGQLRPQAQSQPRPVACAGRCGARAAPCRAAGPSSRTGNLAR